ncbi:MAG: DUF819 family protein [Candidatus Cyclobacteriaceae bacterium M3_2C_046]
MVQILFLILFPLLILFIYKHLKLLKWISPVVWCYATGLFIANTSLIDLDKNLTITVSEISIPLAIALILFSIDFTKWFRTARTAAFSFFLGILGATFSSVLAAYIFAGHTEEIWKIAGMTIGVYTGGTPNMSAIGLSLDVSEETFILVNAADIFLGGIYLVFLLTIAHPLLKKILPRYQFKSQHHTAVEQNKGLSHYQWPEQLKYIIIGLVLGALVLGIAVGFSFLLLERLSVVSIILAVTSLGILGSLIAPVRKLPGTFDTGQYLLLIFCLSIGSLADFNYIIDQSSVIFYFCLIAMFGAILIHLGLAYIFRIDADTMLITSVAGIYGPAFVPPVANVMKNQEIVITGLTTGIIGYAVANYWGLLVAYLLQP